MRNLVCCCCLGWVLMGMNVPAFGQTPNAQVQSHQARQETTAERDAMGWPKDEDDEFGTLMELKKTKPWYVMPYASAQGYWTSNVLLANNGEKGDSVFAETQGILTGYRLSPDWNLSAEYSYQLTRYSENPALDVDSHTAGFSSSYQLPWNFQATMGINGLWLDSPDQKVQLYRENNPYVALSQTYSYLEDRLAWSYGYQFDKKWTHPVGYEREEHSLFTGVSYAWLSNLITQVGLRQNWQFYDYRSPAQPVNGRQEWVSSVVAQAVWQPLSFLQVSAYGLAAYDNSVNASFDYKLANAGGSLRFFWKF